MKPTTPHWTDCRDELSERLATVPRLLVATDFDGTLAGIAPRPQDVRMPEGSLASLEALAAHPGVRVAVLSGRALHEVAALTGLTRAVFAGNHGLEIRGAGIDWEHPRAVAARPALDAAAAFLEDRLRGLEGAFVEHKGLTLSMHYRLVAESALTEVEAAAQACEEAFPLLKRHRGKMVIEFRPDADWNKGHALKRLLKGLGLPPAAALYMGDDTTDEDAFPVLGPKGLSLHVGNNPHTTARFGLRDPDDTEEFLAWLRALRVV